MSPRQSPRSLSLTMYGDLDVSIIKEKPSAHSSIPSRIINGANYEKFLSFLLTRINMGEQAYIVVPAIEESETLNIKNLNEILSF